jgi:hypothetical protein
MKQNSLRLNDQRFFVPEAPCLWKMLWAWAIYGVVIAAIWRLFAPWGTVVQAALWASALLVAGCLALALWEEGR